MYSLKIRMVGQNYGNEERDIRKILLFLCYNKE